MPRVSVIIPVHNYAHFLAEAVDSVLAQTYPDFEIIIVDDGSTDHPEAIIDKYTDARIRTIRLSGRGLSAARNAGLAIASGTYVSFLDADDTYLPGKLEAQVRFLDSHAEFGVVSGGWVYTDPTGKQILDEGPPSFDIDLGLQTWLYQCPFIVNSVLIRRCWIDQVQGFDENFRRGEDWDFWLRLAFQGCRMAWEKSAVCTYRMHEGNMSRKAGDQKNAHLESFRKFFANPELPPDLARQQNSVMAHHYLEGACREYQAGMFAEAKQDVMEAIRLDPRMLDQKGEKIAQMLIGWAVHPLVTDPFRYLSDSLDHLPDCARDFLQPRRKEIISGLAMTIFFKAYRKRDADTVRRMFWIGVRNNPKWLANRGVLSIFLKSIRKHP